MTLNSVLDNWYIIVAIVVFATECVFEKNRIRAWLLNAVVYAEKELGNGTGVLKLRYVYDLFITKFPIISKIISFAMFSKLVDSALEEMRIQLAKNSNIKNYIEGE